MPEGDECAPSQKARTATRRQEQVLQCHDSPEQPRDPNDRAEGTAPGYHALKPVRRA